LLLLIISTLGVITRTIVDITPIPAVAGARVLFYNKCDHHNNNI
jgi:hypothetical protein